MAVGATPARDGARLSPDALARELDALFPAAGHYQFSYAGHNCKVRRIENGLMQITDQGDRVVTINHGVVIDEHVLQGDVSAFLSAARQAR